VEHTWLRTTGNGQGDNPEAIKDEFFVCCAYAALGPLEAFIPETQGT